MFFDAILPAHRSCKDGPKHYADLTDSEIKSKEFAKSTTIPAGFEFSSIKEVARDRVGIPEVSVVPISPSSLRPHMVPMKSRPEPAVVLALPAAVASPIRGGPADGDTHDVVAEAVPVVRTDCSSK